MVRRSTTFKFGELSIQVIVVHFQSFADSSHRGVVVAVRAEPRVRLRVVGEILEVKLTRLVQLYYDISI